MMIVRLEGAKTLTSLAQRLYNLSASDARLPRAVKALEAANPHLPPDLSAAPSETPVVAPAAEGLALTPSSKTGLPEEARLLELMRFAGEAAKEIVTAAASGTAPAQSGARAAMLERFEAAKAALKVSVQEPKPVDREKLAAQLNSLSGGVEIFLKTHGG